MKDLMTDVMNDSIVRDPTEADVERMHMQDAMSKVLQVCEDIEHLLDREKFYHEKITREAVERILRDLKKVLATYS
jgi:hypothetical protein